MYHQKYKKNGIHPDDIKGIKDIKKLPFISKDDLRKNYPDKLLPKGYDKNKAYVICTGGTTGKSVSIYTDFYTMGKAAMGFLREMKFYNLKPTKSRFVHIGNFNESRIDKIADEKLSKPLKFVFSVNVLNIDVNTKTKKILEILDKFNPDLIMSYPAVFQHLAYLKKQGIGNNIKPKYLLTGGAMLDNYTKKYVQETFNCPMLNIYQSVEAQGTIANECIHHNWHINTDFYHIEAINDNHELVEMGERGQIVLTRLWGKGTPIIRYTGMDDWVKLTDFKKCECGLETPLIKDGVEGRQKANIVLPNGKVFPPGAFCFIEPILSKNNTYKIKQYQIVQRKLDKIEIYIVIDEKLRDIGVSVDVIKKQIKDIYENKTGPGVEIEIIEVDEIKHPKNANKPAPIVVSHVSQKEGYKVFEQN